MYYRLESKQLRREYEIKSSKCNFAYEKSTYIYYVACWWVVCKNWKLISTHFSMPTFMNNEHNIPFGRILQL